MSEAIKQLAKLLEESGAELVFRHCDVHDAFKDLEKQLAAERAKVALAVKALQKIDRGFLHSDDCPCNDDEDTEGCECAKAITAEALIALQSSDALAAIQPSPTLDQLVELARNYKWTDEDKKRFARSFAYGNIKMHNPDVTREIINAEADKLDMARVRREVARECAEILTDRAAQFRKMLGAGTKNPEFWDVRVDALEKGAKAIIAKFGVKQ